MWVLFTGNGVSIVLAPLWMLALPFIGALGAWLSLRAGGNSRDRLLTALGPAWLIGSILTLGVPLSMVIERQFSLPGWDARRRCAPVAPARTPASRNSRMTEKPVQSVNDRHPHLDWAFKVRHSARARCRLNLERLD